MMYWCFPEAGCVGILKSVLQQKRPEYHYVYIQQDETMSQQLQALRQTCIPEVCFLLHSVLHSAGLNQKVSRYH